MSKSNDFFDPSPLEAGSTAPDFTLRNQFDKEVSLSKLCGSGKTVVLYFYPKAMTPGCTVQACGMRDASDELEAQGAVVLGISPDSVRRLQKFAEKEKLNFDLLADEEREVAASYGVWGRKKFMGREYMGVLRVTFIVDESGVISQVINPVKTKTHHEQVQTALGALQ